jgi:hypothetical protein
MTTLAELNALRVANGMTELKSWKNGQAKLLEAIAKLTPAEAPVEEIVETPAETVEQAVENETPAETAVTVEKAPRGAIGNLVMELLQTEMPYEDIVKQVRETYPSAKTTARSIASVAMDLRAAGLTIPSRRKVAKAKTEVASTKVAS